MGRFIAVVLGLAAGFLGSQAPGFTLQYMQNLQGRVDELRPIVEQFDADVSQYGYTRTAALEECETAEKLLLALCNGYETTIVRFELLSAHLEELEAASIYMKPLILARGFKDEPIVQEIAQSVREQFEPAIPATLDGAAYAGGAFVVVWAVLSMFFGLIGSMFGFGDRR